MDTVNATPAQVSEALARLLAQDPELDEDHIDLTGGGIAVNVATIGQYSRWTWALHEAADGHAHNAYGNRRGRLEAHNTVLGVPVDVVKALAVSA